MATERIEMGSPGVAVVGAGAWGRNLVRNFNELGALAAICDPSEAVACASARDYPLAWFAKSYTEVLSNRDIGAVALATPAVTHFEMAKAALEAGKDVFVEKPLAIDVREGEGLVALAETWAGF